MICSDRSFSRLPSGSMPDGDASGAPIDPHAILLGFSRTSPRTGTVSTQVLRTSISAFFAFSAVPSFRPRFHGAVNRRVTRAPTEITRQADANLVERRFPSKRHGRHDHPRRADAALRAAVLDEGALQRV